MRIPRILLTAPASGSGKTLITCGILQALVNRGLRVASFKCGPDYIDPMFHGRVIGTKSRNLDTFFTDTDTTRYLFVKNMSDCELAVVEGVMGYYDGLGGVQVTGSTYDVARTLSIPAVLIVNAKGASLSILATIKGFLEYQKNSQICAVILNQVSPMIYQQLKPLIEQELSIKVLGYVPKIEELSLESRHLGLVLPGEVERLKEKLQKLSKVLEETLSIDGFLEIAECYADFLVKEEDGGSRAATKGLWAQKIVSMADKGSVRIAVAKDDAFCFTYLDNLELLEEMGAKLVAFSPLSDKDLPEGVCGLILSGGYPELYAKKLSDNLSMRKAVYQAIQKGMPCIAECGGFLYLHRELEDADGIFYPMAGVIDAKAYRTEKLGRFGYVTLEAVKDQLLGEKGTFVRGHEFHYWDSECCGESFCARKPVGKRSWNCVHGDKTLYAGFPHLFFYSNLKVPCAFLESCRAYGGRICSL